MLSRAHYNVCSCGYTWERQKEVFEKKFFFWGGVLWKDEYKACLKQISVSGRPFPRSPIVLSCTFPSNVAMFGGIRKKLYLSLLPQ